MGGGGGSARVVACLSVVRNVWVSWPAQSTSRHQAHSVGLDSEDREADAKKQWKKKA